MNFGSPLARQGRNTAILLSSTQVQKHGQFAFPSPPQNSCNEDGCHSLTRKNTVRKYIHEIRSGRRSEAAAMFDVTSFSRPWSIVHANSPTGQDHIFTRSRIGKDARDLLTCAEVPCDVWCFYSGLNTHLHEDDCTETIAPCKIYLTPEAKAKSALLVPAIVYL